MKTFIKWMMILIPGFIMAYCFVNEKYGASALFLFIEVMVLYGLHANSKQSKKVPDMTGKEYELHCSKYLLRHGFKEVTVTPASNDYGADLIAKDKHGDIWVFQCKRYNSSVGNSAVQEVVAAKAHYKATKAAVMTNNKLTRNAKRLAMENEIELFEMIED